MMNKQSIDNFQKHVLPMAGSKDLVWVDLGVGDGERGEWLLDKILVGLHDRYVGLDTWDGHPEVEDQARRRLGRFGENAVLKRSVGMMALLQLPTHQHQALVGAGIDFLHCDDTRRGWDWCMLDLVCGFRLMPPGGLVIVSGYRQKGRRQNPALQQAADAFAQEAGGEIEIVVQNSQAIFRKLSPEGIK